MGPEQASDVVSMAAVLGARLRAVRHQTGLSLSAVEEMSNGEFTPSALGAYERGERNISVPRLQRLATFYNVSVADLLPQDEEATGTTTIPTTRVGMSPNVIIDVKSTPTDFGGPPVRGRRAGSYRHPLVIGGLVLALVAVGVGVYLALSMGKGSQTITFTSFPPTNAHVRGPSYKVAATGGRSRNSVTFTSATPSVCTVFGSIVSFIGAGTCTVEANQAGNGDYRPAPTASQNIPVTDAESIYSANSATATVGSFFGFTVMTSGLPPVPMLRFEGGLPKGLSFADNHDGTATISGVPVPTTTHPPGDVYHLTLLATFGTGKTEQLVSQPFSLFLDQAPAITSKAAKVVRIGSLFTASIKATGYPLATLTETGALPSGVSFVSTGFGTATLGGIPATGSAGTYPITITANNGVGSPATQSFSLVVKG